MRKLSLQDFEVLMSWNSVVPSSCIWSWGPFGAKISALRQGKHRHALSPFDLTIKSLYYYVYQNLSCAPEIEVLFGPEGA